MAEREIGRGATATDEGVANGRTNWAGNYRYSTDRLLEPGSVAEVQAAVRSLPSVRALGSRHSFNAIADSTVAQISLGRLQGMELNALAGTVTVGAGVTYGALAPWLDARGFALANLASLPHITVIGACSTGTHGSGVRNGSLATAVAALEFVDGRGDVRRLSRVQDGDRFAGAVVALGALGIVTQITLDVEPAFAVQQDVFLDLPFANLEANFDAIVGAGYSVSLFTDWQKKRVTQVWIKSRVQPGESVRMPLEFFGAKAATRAMHPLLDHPAEHSTEQMGAAGPWYERLPHFRMEFTPSSGQEIQGEYFVPRALGMAAIQAVAELRDDMAPPLFVSEIRTIAADNLWLSPCYRQDSVALHFTWKPEWDVVRRILPKIEAKLEPFTARPHWGKVFTMEPKLVQSHYARLREFRALAMEFDPEGKFRNAFVRAMLFEG